MASDTYHGLIDTALTQIKGVDRWRFFRQRIWERDNGICGLCQEPVSISQMDMDHIVPAAEGGPYHWDNLRATHAHCNRRRGGIFATDRQRVQRLASKITNILNPIKLPPDLHAALAVQARREQRSLNAQIIYLLRKAVEAQTS